MRWDNIAVGAIMLIAFLLLVLVVAGSIGSWWGEAVKH
jgi:hypothetical protein